MSALCITFLTVSISDWLFKGELPPVFDSVGVNSKENFCKFILEAHEFFLANLVSLAATISKTLFVHFKRWSIS